MKLISEVNAPSPGPKLLGFQFDIEHLVHGALEVVNVIRDNYDEEAHQECNLALREGNLALVRTSRGTVLAKSSDGP